MLTIVFPIVAICWFLFASALNIARINIISAYIITNYTIFERKSEGDVEWLGLWFVDGNGKVAGEYFMHRICKPKNTPEWSLSLISNNKLLTVVCIFVWDAKKKLKW